MTNSSLKAALERLGPVRVVDRDSSGSRETLVLHRAGDLSAIKAIPAAMALAECGISLLKAKRAIEQVVDDGTAYLILPSVPDRGGLSRRLQQAGIRPKFSTPQEVSVRDIRKALGFTQEQFAACFGMELRSIENYEAGRRKPDKNVRAFLSLIEQNPDAMKKIASS